MPPYEALEDVPTHHRELSIPKRPRPYFKYNRSLYVVLFKAAWIMPPFSRSHESEADKLGLILMAKACFNPREAPEFWKRMAEAQRSTNKPIEFMSTHPSDETRISNLNALMPNAVKLYEENCK